MEQHRSLTRISINLNKNFSLTKFYDSERRKRGESYNGHMFHQLPGFCTIGPARALHTHPGCVAAPGAGPPRARQARQARRRARAPVPPHPGARARGRALADAPVCARARGRRARARARARAQPVRPARARGRTASEPLSGAGPGPGQWRSAGGQLVCKSPSLSGEPER